MFRRSLQFCLALLASTHALLAGTPYTIDFTDPSMSSAHGAIDLSGKVSGIDWTIEAGSDLPGDSPSLYWGPNAGDSRDGFGVDSNNSRISYQIEGDEYIEITLAAPMRLESFTVNDLYFEEGSYNESGLYSINGGAWQLFEAPSSSSGGMHTFLVQQSMVSGIRFKSVVDYAGDSRHDFGLTSLEVVNPEPSTYLLLGASLMLVAYVRARRLAAQSRI